MGANSDHSPRIATVPRLGQDVQGPVREPLATLCGELDARAFDHIEGLIGALSRTQASQPEAREGFELRLWVSHDSARELEYEVCDLPVATLPAPA